MILNSSNWSIYVYSFYAGFIFTFINNLYSSKHVTFPAFILVSHINYDLNNLKYMMTYRKK